MRTLKSLGVSIPLVLLLACGIATIIQRITDITNLVQDALNVVEQQQGLTPAQLQTVEVYLTAVEAGNTAALAVIASGETGAKEAADITNAYAIAVLPALSLPPVVRLVLDAISAGVDELIAQLRAHPISALKKSRFGGNSDRSQASALLERNRALSLRIRNLGALRSPVR